MEALQGPPHTDLRNTGQCLSVNKTILPTNWEEIMRQGLNLNSSFSTNDNKALI